MTERSSDASMKRSEAISEHEVCHTSARPLCEASAEVNAPQPHCGAAGAYVEVSVGLESTRGVRENMEDAGLAIGLRCTGSLASDPPVIVGVFDGVGGVSGGKRSSRIAARAISGTLAGWLGGQLGERVVRRLDEPLLAAFHAANEAVAEANQAVHSHGATTGLVAIVFRGRSMVASVGDSRAYLVRRGDATRLTVDHTNAQDRIERGTTERNDAASVSDAHVLSRWLGASEMPAVDVRSVDLRGGDTLVLVTDGVHGVLSDAAIARLVAGAASAQDAANRLVEEALRRGTTDNATAVCAQLSAGIPTGSLSSNRNPSENGARQ